MKKKYHFNFDENVKNNLLEQTLCLDTKDVESFNNFEISENEDEEILLNLLTNDINKNIEKENKTLSKMEKTEATISFIKQNKKINKKTNSNKLKFSENKLSKKIKTFLLNAYKIICDKNYKVDEDVVIYEHSKEIKDLLNLINYILLENSNNNCNLSIVIGKKEKSFNDMQFVLNIYALHKLVKFNGLLNITIVFKIKIEMAIRSGDVKMHFSKCLIDYENKKQEKIFQPNFNCLLINNNLGYYGITYCTCGDCMKCKNRDKPKPFDDLLKYLKEKNNIPNKVDFTGLWFGRYNKYRNESEYKCSFCKEFYIKKLNIVKLFCNPDYDPDHSCQFWICRDCYNNRKNEPKDILCPNCGKFKISFSKISRIYRYYRWKKKNRYNN